MIPKRRNLISLIFIVNIYLNLNHTKKGNDRLVITNENCEITCRFQNI